MPRYPIGISDFTEIRQQNYEFVDKRLFIKEVIDHGAKVILLPRPRRFGKTLNLSMLQAYFDINRKDDPNLFEGLLIEQQGQAYLDKKHGHPVIFITFKEIKQASASEAFEMFALLISELYVDTLPQLTNLSPHSQKYADDIINRRASLTELSHSIKMLMDMLYKQTGKQVLVLIDEYDAPLITAHQKDDGKNNYYEQMVEFFRALFDPLKDSTRLYKGILTGILRVSKESLFSGLNNLSVYTLLDQDYSSHFGFLESEVKRLVKQSGHQLALAEIKDWYNGYHIGNHEVYNPWSILKYLAGEGQLAPHWVNTSDNALLRDLIENAVNDDKEALQTLLQGGTVTQRIEPNLSFGDFKNQKLVAFWSFLTFCGYFTPVKTELIEGEYICELAIPNKEVASIYRKFVAEWFEGSGENQYQHFLDALTQGDITIFERLLNNYLKETTSFFDFGQKTPEQVYHAFALGLVVGLSANYVITSNRESGYGRYDLMLKPKNINNPKTPFGIVLEFKATPQKPPMSLGMAEADFERENALFDAIQAARSQPVNYPETEAMRVVAQSALAQINDKDYAQTLRSDGVKKILKLGIAFSGRLALVAHQYD